MNTNSFNQTSVPYHFSKITIWLTIICIAFIALSVHVVMMEVFDIPYPDVPQKTGYLIDISSYLRHAGVLFSALWLYLLSGRQPKTKRQIIYEILGSTLLLLMVNESLLRGPIMNAIGSGSYAWLFFFTHQLLPDIFYYLAIALAVIVINRHIVKSWKKIAAVLFATGLLLSVVMPLGWQSTGFLLTFVAPPIIGPQPNGASLLIPAYLTYIEAALACFVIAWLTWPKLAKTSPYPIALFSSLIMLLTHRFFELFIYPFYASLPPSIALLSIGQFSLEGMVLGLLTALLVRHLYHSKTQIA